MKYFSIMGVHWKIQFLGGRGVLEKAIYRGELPKKAWAACRFKGGLAKKMGVVFLRGGETPTHTMPDGFKNIVLLTLNYALSKWRSMKEFPRE